MKNKLILRNMQSPGDSIALAAAIKSLHESSSNYITDVRTPHQDIFINNPFITKLDEADTEVKIIDLGYTDSINRSNTHPSRFMTGFTEELSKKLGIKIWPTAWSPVIFINSDDIKNNIVKKILGRNVPYIISSFSFKKDYPTKAISFTKCQDLVSSHPEIYFINVGAKGSNHVNPKLIGNNVIDLVGRTTLRDLIALVYHSFGVISYVSLCMHLAYAIPANPIFGRNSRMNITLAGGRENPHYFGGPNHQIVHSCGLLKCSNGGCWRSRVIPLGDGSEHDKSLCEKPVFLDNPAEDQKAVPLCMDMISTDEISRIIEKYYSQLDYTPRY